jgi:hypothetical protein
MNGLLETKRVADDDDDDEDVVTVPQVELTDPVPPLNELRRRCAELLAKKVGHCPPGHWLG